jgi:assimilatory nitrate reductase catalytic subunit
VLPAAGWGEKDGTFINSERRVGLVRKVRRAPGQALADFQIFRAIAHVWGAGSLFEKWATPEDVFASTRELTRGQPCDMTGITGYEMLERVGGVQWPLAVGATAVATERRLFEDGRYYREGGRALFAFETPRPPPDATDAGHPLVLLTGRDSSGRWHTQTRTRQSAVLRSLYRDEAYVEIHPRDAARIGIGSGDRVRVSSRRGSLLAVAAVQETVPAGSVYLPMHDAGTNRLTHAAFDPYSRQPSYKYCAVRVDPA